MKRLCILGILLLSGIASAQIATGSKKFLGNITTTGQVRADFSTYWNHITAENECRWNSAEATRDVMNWTKCDVSYTYAKNKGIPFTFYTLVWGGTTPSWFPTLSTAEQLAEITEWFDAVKTHYPDPDIIVVANEPVNTTFAGKTALGGAGASGYDWAIKAFKMARDRWPNALLICNEYDAIQYTSVTNNYVALVNALKSAGTIDAVGLQGHGLENLTGTQLKTKLDALYSQIQLPFFITEYDIGIANDDEQKSKMEEQFPIFWNADYVGGISFWGYLYLSTFTPEAGLVKADGTERPAMGWLITYVSSHLDVNSPYDWRSPDLGMSPNFQTLPNITLFEKVTDVATIEATVTGTTPITYSIQDGDDALLFTLNASTHKLSFKSAPIYATPTDKDQNNVYEVNILAQCGIYSKTLPMKITISPPQTPYNGSASPIPGLIEAEEYDKGVEGQAYHETNLAGNQGTATFRPTDEVDIDITEDASGDYNISFTKTGEWLAYTVQVKTAGSYTIKLRLATNGTGKTMHMEMGGANITGAITVPNTGGWQTWQTVEVKKVNLSAGQQTLFVAFDADYISLNWIEFVSEATTNINTVAKPESPKLVKSTNPASIQIQCEGSFEYQILHYNGTIAEAGNGTHSARVGTNLPRGLYIVKVQSPKHGGMVQTALVEW